MKRARVIGAGLSGLAAAWHLADRGFDVTVCERHGEPGGLIHSRPTPLGIVETAANAFVWDDTVAEWFRRLDLSAEFPRLESRRRYIFRDGRARRWPLAVGESLGMASRLSAALVTRSMSARNGETVAEWGHRVVGPAATRWLLAPAMQGIYASPPEVLSARAIFSRRRGPRKLVAPSGGMGQFITALHDRLVQRGVHFEFKCVTSELDDRQPTIVATGAPEAARLVAPHAPAVARAIAEVRVVPLVTVTMFFEPQASDLHGFGVLFPGGAGVAAYGVLHNTDIFAGRGSVRSETWIVGAREAGMTEWPDARLTTRLLGDRATVTGRDTQPLAVHITRWPRAIPVYGEAVLNVARELPALPPWLGLAGNYVGRIGVAALLEQAALAAGEVR